MTFRQDNRKTLSIYADESCKDSHRFLVIGGLILERDFARTLTEKLVAVRHAHQTFGEVKWVKVSRSKLEFYKAFVDVFFDCNTDELNFSALHVDTHTFNHGRFNSGSREIGFNKLVYQLLLHKFGRRYGPEYRLEAYLDARVTKHHPEQMRPMLNADLKRRWSVLDEPFRRVTFFDSRKSEIIQLADLLNGMIGFFKNRHHKAPGCAPHKIELMWHIARRVKACQPERPDEPNASRFAIWPFAFKKRGSRNLGLSPRRGSRPQP